MKLKKMDIILITVVCVLAIGGMILYSALGSKKPGNVVVEIDGEVYGEYSLSKKQEVKINETNLLLIEDGEANMKEADCPDQICVKHKSISKTGETIVCLPNKVVVTISGAEDAVFDAVTD